MAKNRKGRRKSQHRKQSTKDDADAQEKGGDDVIVVDEAVKTPHSSNASDLSSMVSGKRKEISNSEEDATEVTGIDTDSKPTSKKKRKKKRKGTSEQTSLDEKKNKLEASEDQGSSEAETAVVAKEEPDFPYPIAADDHCESPLEAYQDIAPLLTVLCTKNNKTSDSLRIYDPYYCDGAVIRNFVQLGFSNVYHQKEDCYKVWSSSNGPQFDVLVTNPPYSDDHIEKLVRYITSSKFGSRPWFLLLPQWAHKKDFYATCTKNIRPFYLVPRKRYVYLPPKDFRESKKSDVHKKSSPFVSMWFCWGGTAEMNDKLIQHYSRNRTNGSACDLARSKSALRDLRRKPR